MLLYHLHSILVNIAIRFAVVIQSNLFSFNFYSHPSHVPQILAILRRQGLLNVLLSSCIRPKSQTDSGAPLTFEISAISLDHMSVTFEHPLLEQMCSVEIDLGMDPTFIRCSLFGADEERSSSDEYATKVLQRCLSIPVTMRAILRQVKLPNFIF